MEDLKSYNVEFKKNNKIKAKIYFIDCTVSKNN